MFDGFQKLVSGGVVFTFTLLKPGISSLSGVYLQTGKCYVILGAMHSGEMRRLHFKAL